MATPRPRKWTATPTSTTKVVTGLFRSRNYVWDSDHRIVAKFGVTWTQFLILRALRFSNPEFVLSPTELYAATQASSSGTAKMLKGLQDDGYVDRLPNADDARSTLVRLTDKGADLVEAIVDELMAINTKLLGGILEEDELDQLAVLLQKLSVALEARKAGN